MSITINADSPKVYPVDLVGKKYNARAPKAAVALKIAELAKTDFAEHPEKVEELISTLVSSLFSKKDAASVAKRLQDPEDALDVEHLSQLSQAIGEAAADRPTT